MDDVQSQDPFRPPKASLEAPDVERVPQPRRAKIAGRLLWLSASLSILLTSLPWLGVVPKIRGENFFVDTFSAATNFALLGLIAHMIGKGRNWARWLLAVIWALGFVGITVTLGFGAAAWKSLAVVQWAGAIVQTGLQFAVVFLAFTGESRAWFRQGGAS